MFSEEGIVEERVGDDEVDAGSDADESVGGPVCSPPAAILAVQTQQRAQKRRKRASCVLPKDDRGLPSYSVLLCFLLPRGPLETLREERIDRLSATRGPAIRRRSMQLASLQ